VPATAVQFVKVDARPTAVVAQTTTWAAFPSLLGQLLGEVYDIVRDLATGSGGELWQNVMLYKDQRPQQAGADRDQVLALLRDLEKRDRVRRTGQRRATRWHAITDEDRIRGRAAELARRSKRRSK
jgi:hypothetical protein